MIITLNVPAQPSFILSNLEIAVRATLDTINVSLLRLSVVSVGATSVVTEAVVEPGSTHLGLSQSALQTLCQTAITPTP